MGGEASVGDRSARHRVGQIDGTQGSHQTAEVSAVGQLPAGRGLRGNLQRGQKGRFASGESGLLFGVPGQSGAGHHYVKHPAWVGRS